MESLLLVGANHKCAEAKTRGCLAFTRAEIPAALAELRSGLSEVAILSTCNRTEIYASARHPEEASESITRFLAARAERGGAESPALYCRRGIEAAEHLFTVACGLDSMVLGEFEILGQVREAYQLAADQAAAGPLLSALFQRALHAGKRARDETAIGRGAMSLAFAAVELARRRLTTLCGRCVLVIGAGEMGQRVAKNLRADRACTLIVANRTFATAVRLAQELGGRAVHFDGLDEALVQADVVISATGAPHVVLDETRVRRALERRGGRSLCLIDIAVPHDIEPAVRGLPHVDLFDIDSLEGVVREHRTEREAQVAQVQAILWQEVEQLRVWCAARRAAPAIGAVQRKADEIRRAELHKLLRRLDHLALSADDRRALEAFSSSLTRRLLSAPLKHAQEMELQGDDGTGLRACLEDRAGKALLEWFGLAEEGHASPDEFNSRDEKLAPFLR